MGSKTHVVAKQNNCANICKKCDWLPGICKKFKQTEVCAASITVRIIFQLRF